MAIEESEGKQAQEVGRCHRFYYARVVSFRADHFRFLVETDCPPPPSLLFLSLPETFLGLMHLALSLNDGERYCGGAQKTRRNEIDQEKDGQEMNG